MADKLIEAMKQLAGATGKNVVVGVYSHRDDYFANCDGIEYEGSTPLEAVNSVKDEVVKRSRNAVAGAQRTIEKDQYLRTNLGMT